MVPGAELDPQLKPQIRTYLFVQAKPDEKIVNGRLSFKDLLRELDAPRDRTAQQVFQGLLLVAYHAQMDTSVLLQGEIENQLRVRSGKSLEQEKVLDEQVADLEADKYVYRVHGYDTRDLNSNALKVAKSVRDFYSDGFRTLPQVGNLGLVLESDGSPALSLVTFSRSIEDRIPKTLKGFPVVPLPGRRFGYLPRD